MNIITCNVNGLNTIVKKGFFESIKNMDPHIFCLLEIKEHVATTLLRKIKPIAITYIFNDKLGLIRFKLKKHKKISRFSKPQYF